MIAAMRPPAMRYSVARTFNQLSTSRFTFPSHANARFTSSTSRSQVGAKPSSLLRRSFQTRVAQPQLLRAPSIPIRNSIIARLFKRNIGTKRLFSSKPHPPPPPPPAPPAPQSLSARLKKLSREYGYSALGVYLALSALDFPLCFLAVRALGADRIGEWEDAVLGVCWKGIEAVYPDAREKWRAWRGHDDDTAQREGIVAMGDGSVGLRLATNENGDVVKDGKHETASLGTQLALAYAIHKSFIFIRVPLTAAITPKVVKVLRSWGWNIGKRSPKKSKK